MWRNGIDPIAGLNGYKKTNFSKKNKFGESGTVLTRFELLTFAARCMAYCVMGRSYGQGAFLVINRGV